MKSGNRSNALLVELLIVIMFFMLSATVLLELYAASRNLSTQAGDITMALNEAQNVADQLYANGSSEAALKEMGFAQDGESWRKSMDAYDLVVTVSQESTPSGVMRRNNVKAMKGQDVFFTLPVARYEEVQQ